MGVFRCIIKKKDTDAVRKMNDHFDGLLNVPCCSSSHPPPSDKSSSADPKFVAAHLIPDNDDRDNDKVYFFFTEKATEAGDREGAIHTRVGRVCAVRHFTLRNHMASKAATSSFVFHSWVWRPLLCWLRGCPVSVYTSHQNVLSLCWKVSFPFRGEYEDPYHCRHYIKGDSVSGA